MAASMTFALLLEKTRRIPKFNVTGTEYRLSVDPLSTTAAYDDVYSALHGLFDSECFTAVAISILLIRISNCNALTLFTLFFYYFFQDCYVSYYTSRTELHATRSMTASDYPYPALPYTTTCLFLLSDRAS